MTKDNKQKTTRGITSLVILSTLAIIVVTFAPNLAFAATLPGAPSGLTATVQNVVDVLLSWTAGSGATSYRIDRALGSGSFTTIVPNTGSSATTYTDRGLSENTQYSYRVFSINGTGTSASASNTATATTGGFGHGGCTGDCVPPTIGMDSNGIRWVDEGFSYNGNSVNVELFYTPYPLITANVGFPNKAVFKIFEDGGPDEVRHFDLAFGLAKGQILADSRARIEWDKTWDGTETLNVIDPKHALQNVRVNTFEGACMADEILQQNCLIIEVYHTFRAPLDFDIVATNVWDEKRNTWQNYYNHGINVVGESLNPAEVHQVMDKSGHLYTISETSNTAAIDAEGNSWTLVNGFWTKDFVEKQQETEPISTHGIDRNHYMHNAYKKGQEILAKETLKQIVVQAISEKSDDAKQDNRNYISRAEDKQLRSKIILESEKALELSSQLYGISDRYVDQQEKHLNCVSVNICHRT